MYLSTKQLSVIVSMCDLRFRLSKIHSFTVLLSNKSFVYDILLIIEITRNSVEVDTYSVQFLDYP